MAGSAPNPRGLLRRLAALLIRGPEAPFILADLDELLERDIEQGMAGARAHSRYLRNAVASAYSVARRRTRMANGEKATPYPPAPPSGGVGA